MAVINNATLIEDHETAPTYSSIGGGQGAVSDADFFRLGVLSSSRKQSGTSYPSGFWFTDGTLRNMSAAGTHFKTWVLIVTPGNLLNFGLRLGSGQSDYEQHDIGVGFYPLATAGWVPVWVEVGSGSVTGTPLFNSIDEYAVIAAFSTISSNLKNLVVDQSHFSVRPVLVWIGSTGSLDDFIATEDTFATGTLVLRDGVYFCFSSLQIGSSSATTFIHNSATVSFPDATWLPAASTWMGLNINLSNASTSIDLAGCTFQSANPTGASARKPDFIVAGVAAGAQLLSQNCTFNGMRTVELNRRCVMDGSKFANCGVIDVQSTGTVQAASMIGCSIIGYDGAANTSALTFNGTQNVSGELDGMTFEIGANATHAMEFGLNSNTSITLTGITSTGYNAANGNDDSFFHFLRTSGTIIVNISNSTGNFSHRTEGATIILNIDPVTIDIHVDDENGDSLENAMVILEASDNTGEVPFEDTVTITNVTTTASVAHTAHGMTNGDKVVIRFANENPYNGVFAISNVTTNAYDYTMGSDPGGNATGTIQASGVILQGLTNASGNIEESTTFSGNQPVKGFVRKSTGSPLYKDSPLNDTVDSSGGLSISLRMIRDD